MTIMIRVSKTSTGYFAYLVGDEMKHGAGSTPRLAVERLMAAARDVFGAAAVEKVEAAAVGEERAS